MVGTHTHAPTADAQILPKGTAFLTDVGMTGPHDSVIGARKDLSLRRFLLQQPQRLEPADGDVRLEGALVTCGDDGRATDIVPVRRELADG
mgnify:CR=1 FL=1